MALDTSTDSFEDDDPPTQVGSDSAAAGASATEPLACVSCRARKLKCDRIKPACSRCVKIDGACVYPESRRKPTIKRRNVKELEARLGTVHSPLSGTIAVQICYLLHVADICMLHKYSSGGGVSQGGLKERRARG